MEERWLSYFGLPKILQTDNGPEFKNKLLVETINRWDGDCKLVYGRPRHPQSQGLVEQANGTVEKMIGAGMEQYQTKSWSKLLPIIQLNLNTSKPSSTKITFLVDDGFDFIFKIILRSFF